MLNRLRDNSLIVITVGLLLGTPLVGSGQNAINEIKQRAKAAKLSPDLLNLELEVAQQNSLLQQSGSLRQAAPSTDGINTPKNNRLGSHNSQLVIENRVNPVDKQGLRKGSQLKSTAQQSGSLRQAALSADDIRAMKLNLMQVRDGMVAIEAIANEADGQALLTNLQAIGLKDGRYYQRIVFGYFPVDKLNQLRNVPTLHVARPALKPATNVGKVTSQGDYVMRSDIARQTYSVTGAGSKIGILSDSYNALGGAADGVASGDLPAGVQVLKDGTLQNDSTLTDEGRGMAEIVHDIAPGAALAFHTAFESYIDFALGIRRLANAGCNIIVDDIYYYAEPFFQDGIIAQAVDYVNKNQGVTYFSSAGNSARKSYTSGFRNSGKPAPGLPLSFGHAHDFGNGALTQKVVVLPGRTFIYDFQWSDPFYSDSFLSGGVSGAKTDMDVFIYYEGELIPELSSYDPNIGGNPFEINGFENIGEDPIEIEIALVKYEGPDPILMKSVFFTSNSTTIEYINQNNTGTLFGHSNAKGAIAVGASAYYQTPAYSSNSYPDLNEVFVPTPNPLAEVFSSAGGTPILFTTYGQPVPAETRLKPEISAPDGGNTSFFYPGDDFEGDGFPNFGGTSAAAPHAAGVAALLQEKAHNSMTPANILLRLRTTALDMDDPFTPGFDMGFDFGTGFGLIQADKALMYGQPLVLLEPLYNCQTGEITLRTSGGDGTPITFTAPGVRRTPPTSTTISVGSFYSLYKTIYTTYTPTSTTGIVEAGLRNDPKNIIITAEQGGVKIVYDFNFAAYCGSQAQARIAATEPGAGLQITTLGNPISTDWLNLEVRGAKGQPLKLQVNNTLGGMTGSRAVEMAESVERHTLQLGHSPGLYFLHVSTPSETKTIKVIRQ